MVTFFFLAVIATSSASDQKPLDLVAPQKHKNPEPVKMTDDSSAPELIGVSGHRQAPTIIAAQVPPARHLLLGVAAGGIFGPSGPLRLGGNARFMIGYIRPDEHDGLGISIEPEVAWAQNGEPQSQKSKAFLFSVPLLAPYNLATKPGLLRILVGPSFDYFNYNRSGTWSGESLGFEAGAAYLFNLVKGDRPNHTLGLDVRFHYLPDSILGEKTNSYLITVGASYAFVH